MESSVLSALIGSTADDDDLAIASAARSALGDAALSVGFWGAVPAPVPVVPADGFVESVKEAVVSQSPRPVYVIPLSDSGSSRRLPTSATAAPAVGSPRQSRAPAGPGPSSPMSPSATMLRVTGRNVQQPEPVSTESRKTLIAETTRLCAIEEGAVTRQAELLLSALGAQLDAGVNDMSSHTASSFAALGLSGLDKASLSDALRASLAGLTRKDITFAIEFDRHLTGLVMEKAAARLRKDFALTRMAKSPRGRDLKAAAVDSLDLTALSPAPTPRSESAASEAEAAAVAAAGGGVVAATVASLDTAALLDAFVVRRLFGLPKAALLAAVPASYVSAAASLHRNAKSSVPVRDSGVFSAADKQESLPPIALTLEQVFDSDCISSGAAPALGSGGGIKAPLLGETITRTLMAAHCRGSLMPLIKAVGGDSPTSSPGGDETARSLKSPATAVGASPRSRSPKSGTPSWRQAPKRLSPDLVRPIPLSLTAGVTKALFSLGLEPRSTSLVQYALALRVRSLQVALAVANERGLEALRLPPMVAAALGCPAAAGSEGAQASARNEMAKAAARRSSMTADEIEAAIEMGREKGYLKYARTIPGLKFQPSPPKVVEKIDDEEEIDSVKDPKINFAALLSDVDKRSAARNAVASSSTSRIQTLNVDEVKAAAKSYAAKIAADRRAAQE